MRQRTFSGVHTSKLAPHAHTHTDPIGATAAESANNVTRSSPSRAFTIISVTQHTHTHTTHTLTHSRTHSQRTNKFNYAALAFMRITTHTHRAHAAPPGAQNCTCICACVTHISIQLCAAHQRRASFAAERAVALNRLPHSKQDTISGHRSSQRRASPSRRLPAHVAHHLCVVC